MPTVSIHMPEQSGETGQVLYLRKVSDGTLLNAGGDALTESPASSGRFTATVAESITETLHAAVVSGSLTVRDGWLAAGETLVRDAFPDVSADAVSEIQSGLATAASIAALNDLDSTAVQAAAAAALTAYDPPTNAEMEARTLEAADYATAAALTAAPAEVITLLGSGTEVYGHSYLESIKRIEVVSGAATLSGAGTGTEVMTSSDSSKTATFTVDGSGNVSAVVWN